MSRVIVEKDLRPCIAGDKRALFHEWYENQGIVELEDGTIKLVHHNYIKFIDEKIKEYHF